ncbi:hypothetical protein [Bergeriella denitrificans]|nr:hypothetical protein [Bergeriella denitrificans]
MNFMLYAFGRLKKPSEIRRQRGRAAGMLPKTYPAAAFRHKIRA